MYEKEPLYYGRAALFIQNLLEILWHNDHRSSAIDSD
jgi:hypothetical protein